jgi:transcriptional regulator with XRE-family HTH domain
MEAKEILTESSVKAVRKEYFATEEKPFHFVDSGLDNVYLIGIKYFVDENGHKIAEIPALQQLMQLIARDIVLSPCDLAGNEVRFLRKRLGKKGTEYCSFLGIEPETLSRIENDKQQLSAQGQKLARLSYCVFSADLHLVECARSIFQSIIEEIKTTRKRERIVLKMDEKHEWQELRAA